MGVRIAEKAGLWYGVHAGKKRCPSVETCWQTETGVIVATSLPGIGPFKPAHTGLPLPGIRLRVLDERGKLCEPGEEGNVCLLAPFAPGLLGGVWGDKRKLLETYWSEYPRKTIYFSGDLGVYDKDGMLRVVGRAGGSS